MIPVAEVVVVVVMVLGIVQVSLRLRSRGARLEKTIMAIFHCRSSLRMRTKNWVDGRGRSAHFNFEQLG